MKQSRPRAPHLLAWAILAATSVILLAVSFERWGDPIIDLGRDLYLPGEILDGRTLYRDLLYNYGPITPYLLAAVSAIFGDQLVVFEVFGLLVTLATAVALYTIASRFAGPWGGFAATWPFLALNAFAHSTWGSNFILPYSFAATLGVALALGSLALLLRYLYDGGRARDLAWSTTLLLVALFTKQEVGLALLLVHLLSWWAHRVPARAIGRILGSLLVAIALFFLAFHARSPEEHSLLAENLLKFAGDPVSAPFFALVAGLEDPVANLWWAGESLLRLVVLVGLALLAGSGQRPPMSRWLALASAVTTVALAWLWADIDLMRGLPLLLLAVCAWLLVKDRRDPLLLLAALPLLAAPRILLQYHPGWYGFYLTSLVYPALVLLLGQRLPRRFACSRRTLLLLAFIGLLIVGRYQVDSWRAFRHLERPLVTSKGTLYDAPIGRVEAIAAFLAWAEENLDARRDGLVVMPEGVSLNYFTGLANPTAYYLFTPPEIQGPAVESRMIAELQATRPEWVVMTSRDLTEFGYRGIGLDYGLALGDWLRQNYELERIFRSDERDLWRLIVLRSRAGSPGFPPAATQ